MGFSTFATEYGRLGALIGETATAVSTRTKECVNDAILTLLAEHDWAFMKNTYSDAFNTEATYTTGTLATTKGSTSVTGTGTLPVTAGYTSGATGMYEVAIGDEIYGVTLTNDTTWVLSRAATTTYTAATYTLFRRVYSLAARMRSIEVAWVRANPDRPLAVVSAATIGVRNAGTTLFARPEVIGFSTIDSNDVTRVILDPVPDGTYSVYYAGFQEVAVLTSDGSTIPFPQRFQAAFRACAEMYLWKYRGGDKALERGRAATQLYLKLKEDLIRRDDPSQGLLDDGELDPTWFRRISGRVAPSRSGNP